MLRLSVERPEDGGVDFIADEPHGHEATPEDQCLLDLADAVYSLEPEKLAAARDAVTRRFGGIAMTDALAIAAHFNAITIVADATGIQLETVAEQASEDFRERLGLEEWRPEKRRA